MNDIILFFKLEVTYKGTKNRIQNTKRIFSHVFILNENEYLIYCSI